LLAQMEVAQRLHGDDLERLLQERDAAVEA
jgi:hypothetical protein